MPSLIVTTGSGTFAASSSPAKVFSASGTWFLRPNTAYIYVYMAMPPEIRGRAILAATLSPTAAAANPAFTAVASALDSKLTTSATTWNKKPGVRAGSVNTAVAARTDGQAFPLDVTSIVQTFANGAANYGFRVAISGGSPAEVKLRAISQMDAWTLTIEASTEAGVPSDLYPNGGVVGLGKPAVRFAYTDVDASDFSQVRIQVSPTENPVTAFTATVTTSLPEVDLAATAYPGLASGATTSWRVQVLVDGVWSEYSDWATFGYAPKPAIVLDNPAAAAVILDPSTVIQAHATSGTVANWRALIADGDDLTDLLWDSGLKQGLTSTTFETAIPDQPTSPFDEAGTNYWIGVRAYDRVDRQAGGPSDPPYVEVSRTVTFTPGGAVTAPTDLTAQPVPGVACQTKLTWKRVAAPDGWVVRRNSGALIYLTLDKVTNVAGTWTWIDTAATPNTPTTYEVFAVQLPDSPSLPAVLDGYVPELTGIWIISEYGTVHLAGTAEGITTTDQEITYEIPGARAPVTIFTGFPGNSGDAEGTIKLLPGDTLADTLNRLALIRKNSANSTVRIMAGLRSFPAQLKNLRWAETADFVPGLNTLIKVEFTCSQVGEFDRKH